MTHRLVEICQFLPVGMWFFWERKVQGLFKNHLDFWESVMVVFSQCIGPDLLYVVLLVDSCFAQGQQTLITQVTAFRSASVKTQTHPSQCALPHFHISIKWWLWGSTDTALLLKVHPGQGCCMHFMGGCLLHMGLSDTLPWASHMLGMAGLAYITNLEKADCTWVHLFVKSTKEREWAIYTNYTHKKIPWR